MLKCYSRDKWDEISKWTVLFWFVTCCGQIKHSSNWIYTSSIMGNGRLFSIRLHFDLILTWWGNCFLYRNTSNVAVSERYTLKVLISQNMFHCGRYRCYTTKCHPCVPALYISRREKPLCSMLVFSNDFCCSLTKKEASERKKEDRERGTA